MNVDVNVEGIKVRKTDRNWSRPRICIMNRFPAMIGEMCIFTNAAGVTAGQLLILEALWRFII